MPFFRYAVPAMSLAAGAAAQCSASGTMTITDAAPITACQTFSGSIALATGSGMVDFGSTLRQITGDLVADQTNTTTLTGAALDTITGTFFLNKVLNLQAISFQRLAQVGTVAWTSVPSLNTLVFGTGAQHIDNFTVADSQIQDLSGINLKSANSINIADNSRLSKLDWQIQNVTGMLTLDGNGQPTGQGFSAHFPNLQSAGAISINQVDSLDFSSLVNATGITIYRTSVSNLTFPNLTSVGISGINLYNDQSLTSISFPELATIAGPLQITGNSKLTGNITFPQLTTVQNINATGAFDSFGLPKINTIAGGVNVDTSSSSFQCSNIIGLNPTYTQAKPTCSAGSNDATTTSSSGNGGSGTSGTGRASHTNSAGRVELGAVTLFGAGGLFAAMFGLI